MENTIPQLPPQIQKLALAERRDPKAQKGPAQEVKATREQAPGSLDKVLPPRIMEALMEGGFRAALEAIKTSDDSQRRQLAASIERISGQKLPNTQDELKAIFNSQEFETSFIKAVKSSYKAAKANPAAVSRDPEGFVRAQVEKLSRPQQVESSRAVNRPETPRRQEAQSLATVV